MSIGVILILVVIAFLIGPFAVQLAGGAAIALAVIVLTIEPGGRTIAGVSLAAIGALALFAGSIWRVHRIAGTCTIAGGWVRERIARVILRGNAHARARSWLAIRIAWRLPRWRLERLFREAEQGAGSERQGYDANGSGEQAEENGSDDADVQLITLTEWFETRHPRVESWEKRAPEGSVPRETSLALEDVRRHLEVIMRTLFNMEVGPSWSSPLEERRIARLGSYDGPLKPKHGERLGDSRTLFSVIADDWTMIGACFMRDPSAAAKELLAILDRYDHRCPGEDDPAKATQAFHEILAALRPQAREMLTHDFSRSREGATRRPHVGAH